MKYIFRSLSLDVQFLSLNLSFFEKFEFIYKKYIVLISNIIFGFVPGKSKVSVFGKEYYYDDKFGIAFLQSVYADNAFLKDYIPKHATIVDIGANIGQSNYFYKHYLQAKTVYSFEPIRATFDILKMNCKENVFNYAITNKKKLKLFVPVTSLMASTYRNTVNDKEITVKGITLDTIIKKQKISHIDLIKIDTEGSEYDVILASKATLKMTKYILVEVSMERSSGGSIVEIIVLLEKIVGKLELVKMGRMFIENKKIVAIDLLFKNNSRI